MYRTKITVIVLSEEPIPGRMSLDDVSSEGYTGDFVLDEEWGEPEKLTDEQMTAALLKSGSDPGFFQIADERERVAASVSDERSEEGSREKGEDRGH